MKLKEEVALIGVKVMQKKNGRNEAAVVLRDLQG